MNDVYCARRTVCDMFRVRGYTVPPDVEAQTPSDVLALFIHHPAKLTIVAMHEQSGQLIAALFHINVNKVKEKLGVGCVRQYAHIVSKMGISRAILVSYGLTPLANRELVSPGMTLEPFLFKELVVNILHHDLVPTHEVLQGAERVEFFKRFKLDDLPHILNTDPVVRFLGLQENDVVKITRPDFVAGKYILYRRVVSSAFTTTTAPSEPNF